MTLEQEFGITISDEMSQQWFTTQPASLRRIAAMVLFLLGTGQPERPGRTGPRGPLPAVEVVPFTQLGGAVAAEERQLGRAGGAGAVNLPPRPEPVGLFT